jgi:hypothetical protein
MILAAFAEQQFDLRAEPWLCATAGRWTLQANAKLLAFGFFEQRQSKDSGEWYDCGFYYAVFLRPPRHWRLGFTAFEYDGTHEAINLGPIQVAWCNGSFKGAE